MRSSLLVGVAFAIVGCGGGGGGAPSINVNKDNVCDQVAEVACYDMYRCCSEGEREKYLGVTEPRSEAECREDVKRLCSRALATVEYSLDKGRVTFSNDNMNNCLQALVAPDDDCATIEAMLPWAEACVHSAWVGAVADGGTCEYPYECSSADSVCTSSRTCKAKPGYGEPCGAGCASGLYCNGLMCDHQVGVGVDCVSTQQCTKGLYCDTTATKPVCTMQHAAGEACTGPSTCTSGSCLPGACESNAQPCYTSATCSGHCENTTTFCAGDNYCSTGTCSIGGASCTGPAQCTGAGNVCNFPVKCVPGACTGTIVCADAHVTVDYCSGALKDLPI